MRGLMGAAAAAIVFVTFAGPASAAVGELEKQNWSFDGVFGKFDKAALQRGFQVYQEVCASCHGLEYIAFRNLTELGLDEDQVKAIAAEYEVEDGPDDEGEMFTRPAILADILPSPFANDNAARASNNGALPPDLSLMAKARTGGPDYLHALLTGYIDVPADVTLNEGMSYNPYFPGNQIAMPPPIDDDAVEYTDGTPATVDQMSLDVVQFLMWAAEPKLEIRKRMGIKVILFLLVLTALFYASKRKVWSRIDH